MITKYYDKRESKSRTYYNSPNELFVAKNRIELIDKNIIPSWLGIKNISYYR